MPAWVENRFLYNDDPTHVVNLNPDSGPLSLEDLVYHNFPDEQLVVHRHSVLEAQDCRAFFKRSGKFMPASYLLTLDWWTGNDLLHLLALQNGQFALLPNHKVRFNGDTSALPQYQKLRATWRVED